MRIALALRISVNSGYPFLCSSSVCFRFVCVNSEILMDQEHARMVIFRWIERYNIFLIPVLH